jgi:N-acetylglucosaminylphosphatidylinositol deacetylase
VYTLDTTNILRKYSSLVDLPMSCLSRIMYFTFKPQIVHRAMQAHASQMVWFRQLFIAFSRYTYINTLTEIH